MKQEELKIFDSSDLCFERCKMKDQTEREKYYTCFFVSVFFFFFLTLSFANSQWAHLDTNKYGKGRGRKENICPS